MGVDHQPADHRARARQEDARATRSHEVGNNLVVIRSWADEKLRGHVGLSVTIHVAGHVVYCVI